MSSIRFVISARHYNFDQGPTGETAIDGRWHVGNRIFIINCHHSWHEAEHCIKPTYPRLAALSAQQEWYNGVRAGFLSLLQVYRGYFMTTVRGFARYLCHFYSKNVMYISLCQGKAFATEYKWTRKAVLKFWMCFSYDYENISYKSNKLIAQKCS